MFDKLVKIMAVVGTLCMIAFLLCAASIVITNLTTITGDLTVTGTTSTGSLSTGSFSAGNTTNNGDFTVNGISYAYVPVGTIVAYYGTSEPSGWLICNGQTIPNDYNHSALISLCGTNTPDLRGVFLRGIDGGRGLDYARGLGDYQGDDFRSHNHGGVTSTGNSKFYRTVLNSGMSSAGNHQKGWGDGVSTDTEDTNWSNSNHTHNILVDGGAETRPKNIAVNFIIKY